MAIESIIGFSMLATAFVGYVVSYYLNRINWPLFWFNVNNWLATR